VLPLDNLDYNKETDGEVLMLKWCYYGSISQLLDQPDKLRLSSTWGEGGQVGKRILKLRRAAKVARVTKISSKMPYHPSDKVVNRLAFLAHELDLEKGYNGAHICSLVMRRVRRRAYSKALNPGSGDWHDQNGEPDVSAPWEIFAQSHHSRLLIANLENPKRRLDEVEKYRKKFSPFLTANISLIPCWERTNIATSQVWRRSETPAILATTLLDIYQKELWQLTKQLGEGSPQDPALMEGELERL
jgi:hypothetical protein